MTDTPRAEPARRRPWHWRPASRAALLGWWVACLAVAAVAAVVVGLVAGVIGFVATPSEGFRQFAVVLAAAAAGLVLGYLVTAAASLVTALRFVALARRTGGFWASLAAVVLLAGALLAIGILGDRDLLVMLAGIVHALGVPLVVAPRVPVVRPAA